MEGFLYCVSLAEIGKASRCGARRECPAANRKKFYKVLWTWGSCPATAFTHRQYRCSTTRLTWFSRIPKRPIGDLVCPAMGTPVLRPGVKPPPRRRGPPRRLLFLGIAVGPYRGFITVKGEADMQSKPLEGNSANRLRSHSNGGSHSALNRHSSREAWP